MLKQDKHFVMLVGWSNVISNSFRQWIKMVSAFFAIINITKSVY